MPHRVELNLNWVSPNLKHLLPALNLGFCKFHADLKDMCQNLLIFCRCSTLSTNKLYPNINRYRKKLT